MRKLGHLDERTLMGEGTVYVCLVGAEDSQKPIWLGRSEKGGEHKMSSAR